MDSLVCAAGVVRFILVAVFTGVCPGRRQVHPESLGSQGCALGIVGFILGR